MNAFLCVCLLASAPAVAEEVPIAVGMPYDTAVAKIKRCGGKDITASKQVAQRSGLYWWLQDYNIQIVTGESAGKISSLSYWRAADLAVSKIHERINDDAMREVRAVFRNRKIELWIDGRGPALVGLKVKKTDVEAAVEAISTSPKLQKRGLVIVPGTIPK